MLSRRLAVIVLMLLIAGAAVGAAFWFLRTPPEAVTSGPVDPMVVNLQTMVESYRKVIVLLADVDSLNGAQRQQVIIEGQALFRANHEQQELMGNELWDMEASGVKGRFRRIGAVLDYIEQDDKLFDGDQLAFREPLLSLQGALTQDGSLEARHVNRRVTHDLHALDGIEQQFNGEFEQLFSRSENHVAPPTRTQWNDYVAHLQALYQREQILKDRGVTVAPATPPAVVASSAGATAAVPALPAPMTLEETGQEAHIYGNKFPPKTIALTFDDGPHPKYTAQIVAILQHYHLPGTFFEIGRNLGTINAQGQPVLNKNADITRMLIADGYAVGNHSYTHPVMSKESGAPLLAEIDNTDRLLKAIDKNRDPIFRFPYGAHNPEAMGILAQYHLQSVLWNVDSLDWADPIPNSVADRVLRQVDQVNHGIILFHDIHDRAVKALPTIIDHLLADGYQFAGWDGKGFSVPAKAPGQ